MSKRELSIKERKTLGELVDGKRDVNSKASQEFLSREHVAVTFEKILHDQGLDDEKLLSKAREIMNRKALTSHNDKTGTKSTNQTAVDANALQSVRMILQIKGKFAEGAVKGTASGLEDMTEAQLDQMIKHGFSFLEGGGKSKLDHGGNGGRNVFSDN